MLATNLTAQGLYLYSYTNEEGQRIIVSEKKYIPPRYTNTVKKEFIKMFKPKKNKISLEKPKPRHKITLLKTNSRILIEPTAPITDSTASASIWLAKLSTIQENNERIQILALSHGKELLETRIRNSDNNRLLPEILKITTLKWEGHETWVIDAKKFVRLMQNLQWMANQWMQSGRISFIQNRTVMLRHARDQLERLKTTFIENTAKQ